MRCIFCKTESSGSKSVEHIVPESFGNSTQVLPKGIVCDKCNNYFASKVEQPFLEQDCIKNLRFTTRIANKKGKIPTPTLITGTMAGLDIEIDIVQIDGEVKGFLGIPAERLKQVMRASEIIPRTDDAELLKKNKITARFLAKIAIESFAWRMLGFEDKDEAIESLVDEKGFDDFRKFAREGGSQNWDYNARRIYNANEWSEKESGCINWESDFLVTGNPQLNTSWHFIIVLYGVEYAINMGESDISRYAKWLKANGGISPLYSKKNEKD